APPSRAAERVDERLVLLRDPSGEEAEQFRKVRANLLSARPTPRTILVTSGAPAEGKSLFAANLASAFAETGQGDVLLVDGNLRTPELPALMAARTAPGLSEILLDRAHDPAGLVQSTDVEGLYFLPAGALGAEAAQTLSPKALRAALERLPQRFRAVVIDAPCAVEFADVSLMAPDVDGVVLVVRVEGGRRTASRKAVQILEGAQARVLGAVVWTGG
ncbi:MAG TPA: CpsD/CapB family tyrosine-protein kinase, partial [Planctomycetota bacterium]|nr:CpsD/CapB family tyrosine-protein kinase [Planctomycetota bacterium]